MQEETKQAAGQLPAAENGIIAERRAKLAELRAAGVAFPNDFTRTHRMDDARALAEGKSDEELEARPITVRCAGRMMLKRVMGKASFGTLRDCQGSMQIYVKRDAIGADAYAAFKRMDLGDILGVEGFLFRTRTGELSIHVQSLRLLTKSILPLPEKFQGLTDTEQRYRMRYVDLIMNAQTRETFIRRAKMMQALRGFMQDNGYLEVETPMLHPIPGGANAKPFVTHHNALDMDMFLRVAPELHLKRLVVGGFDRVFELNRCFRNEGVDVRHNPEFTTVEFYTAYHDYRWTMDFTEKLLRHIAVAVTGSETVTYQGQEIDFGKPFARLTPLQAIRQHAPGYTDEQLRDAAFLAAEVKRLGGKALPTMGVGALQMELFDAVAESKLIQPTFLIDYPTEISPLARASDADPSTTERFELYIAGREHANGFSELNDPDDQAARFRAQAENKAKGDDEAMYYDADYIRALEYGLPPTTGCGIGMDRLAMLLTDSPSIRDVLFFPHMRKAQAEDPA